MTAIMDRLRNVLSHGKNGSDAGQSQYQKTFRMSVARLTTKHPRFFFFYLWEYNLVNELRLQFLARFQFFVIL